MARRCRSLCWGFFFFVVWVGTQSSLGEDDLPCLRELKSSLTDPRNSLASWQFANSSLGYVCSFLGVTCWNGEENKVMGLNLAGAGLSGPYRPRSLRTCFALTSLNLSNNSFTGPFPSDICQYLPYLLTLDLSHNLFEGSIPPTLGNCSYLNALYLQHNHLSGYIPSQLGDLPHLTLLDLSSNNLSGRVPSTFTNRSISFTTAKFADNSRLCGWPDLSECPQITSRQTWKVKLLIGASILLAFLLFIAVLVIAFHSQYVPNFFYKRGNSSSLHLFETHLKLTWEEVQLATSNFSPSNIVGYGGSSTVYKGRLLDGQEIAVKVLHNEELIGSELHYTPKQLFLTELRLLGKLRHRNLVKVRGFFSNSESMAIILDYMPAGSLDAVLLHENATSNLAFGWKARLNILLGIAEGLAYLHNEYDGKLSVIHADLKPGNVLLDEYMEAHIADFGIATFVSNINSMVSSKGQALPVPCWSLGYTAPECVQQGLVSRKGDVFSFGVIVLEVITGQRPNSNKLKEGESLAEWVSKALAEGTVEHVIAPMAQRNVEDLSSILRMGCGCACIARAKRPDMSDVVIFLRRLCEKLEDS